MLLVEHSGADHLHLEKAGCPQVPVHPPHAVHQVPLSAATHK
jgi:hypothetical protein